MFKKVLGIDPGSSKTGWGIVSFDGSTYQLLDCGVIVMKTKSSKRYFEIFTEIDEIIESHLPMAISIETQFVKKNIQSALKIGMVRGSILSAAGKHSVEVFEYTPSEAKKGVTGNGLASKTMVSYMVGQIFNKTPEKCYDISDALALAISHCHKCITT